jgi:macrolide transport system ATP-binding/permease protein
LILAAMGLYGITSYAVVRRTSENGVRTALGATRRAVIALVLRSALSQIAAGLILGIPAALLAGRILTDQLYQISPSDRWTLLAAALVVLLSGAAAGIIPALRASAIDPVIALRSE